VNIRRSQKVRFSGEVGSSNEQLTNRDPTSQELLNDLRMRLITLNSRFREADTHLAADNVQNEIWNVLAGIAHLEAKLE
jgi:hypothetical protein